MSLVSTQSNDNDNRSVHSDSVEEVHNVPIDVIIRPIPPVLDEQKVQSLMNSIKVTSCFIYCVNVGSLRGIKIQ